MLFYNHLDMGITEEFNMQYKDIHTPVETKNH